MDKSPFDPVNTYGKQIISFLTVSKEKIFKTDFGNLTVGPCNGTFGQSQGAHSSSSTFFGQVGGGWEGYTGRFGAKIQTPPRVTKGGLQ